MKRPVTTCTLCGAPMVTLDEAGELWCSVYGTHEPWPWTREWARAEQEAQRRTKVLVGDRSKAVA